MERVIDLHLSFMHQLESDGDVLHDLESQGISILQGFRNQAELVRTYYLQFYSQPGQRIVFCGINPGKRGAGLTGIPFIDYSGVSELVPGQWKQDQERSAQFMLSVIREIGAASFHDHIYMTNLSWYGFTQSGNNLNYYEMPPRLQEVFTESFLAEMDIVQPMLIVPLSNRVELTLRKMAADGRLKHPIGEALPHPVHCSFPSRIDVYREKYVALIEKHTGIQRRGQFNGRVEERNENGAKGEPLAMEFFDFLRNRHTLVPGKRRLKENSAKQYNNRLINLQKLDIYNGEHTVTLEMEKRIAEHYSDSANAYPRTIRYYIEYLEYCGV